MKRGRAWLYCDPVAYRLASDRRLAMEVLERAALARGRAWMCGVAL